MIGIGRVICRRAAVRWRIFLQRVAEEMKSTRPVNPEDATRSVFKVLARHVDLGQSAKVRDALPKQIRALWPESVGV